MATNAQRTIVIEDDSLATSAERPANARDDFELPTSSPRGFRLGRRETDRERFAAQRTVETLRQRIAELEAERARAPQLELAKLDPLQIAGLASETAVMILRSARTEADALMAQAQAQRDDAEAAAETLLADAEARAEKVAADAELRAKQTFTEAKTRADKLDAQSQAQAAELRERAETLVRDANAQAEKLRSETETAVSDQLRVTAEQVEAAKAAAVAEVERLRETSEAQAEATHAKAQAEAARIVKEAAARRDGLIADLEAQRRIVDAMIDDSSAVRAVLIEAYGKSRDTLELAIAKLNGPLDTAGRQAAAIAREIQAIQE